MVRNRKAELYTYMKQSEREFTYRWFPDYKGSIHGFLIDDDVKAVTFSTTQVLNFVF